MTAVAVKQAQRAKQPPAGRDRLIPHIQLILMYLNIQPSISLRKLNKKVNFSLFSQNKDISL